MRRLVIYADQDGTPHVEALFRGKHATSDACPGCGADMARVAITQLAYTFAPCNCSAAEYEHLYEQLWHLACLVDHVVANRGRET